MIRLAKEEDLIQIVQIEKESFTDCWNYDQFKYELFDNPYAKIYVIEENNLIIGFIDLWIIFERSELANIAIKKGYRNQGYGKELMALYNKIAKEENCESMALEVRVSNKNAIRLYENDGFIIINTKKGYYQDNYEDAYFMMKGI